MDIPAFIRLLREDDAAAALTVIRRNNPFPGICGRICPAPCEDACIFNDDGSPIAVRTLERYASDFGKPKADKNKIVPKPSGKKVAVIGSGPAGLAAAHGLAIVGHPVDIFESMPFAGGLLRYGIPEFRLPQKVLDETIALVESLGVVVHTNVFVGSTMKMDDLFHQGYGAVLIAAGAGVPKFCLLPGQNSGGVYYAQEFLMRAHASGKNKADEAGHRLMYGFKTIVVGADSAAFDAARLALRFGQEVKVVFSGMEEEMTAHPDDIVAAVAEGITLHTALEPTAILENEEGFARALRCKQFEIKEEGGGLIFQAVPGPEQEIEAQTIILSQGSRPNTFLSRQMPQLKSNPNGTLWTDAATGQTSMEKVFAAGNIVTGAGPVVDAIASGKAAAENIILFLKEKS